MTNLASPDALNKHGYAPLLGAISVGDVDCALVHDLLGWTALDFAKAAARKTGNIGDLDMEARILKIAQALEMETSRREASILESSTPSSDGGGKLRI